MSTTKMRQDSLGLSSSDNEDMDSSSNSGSRGLSTYDSANRSLIEELKSLDLEESFTKDHVLDDTVYSLEGTFIEVFSNPPLNIGVLDKLTAASYGAGERSNIWPIIVRLFTPSSHRIVAYVTQIPGFSELQESDQVVLLRSCVMDILFFRLGCRFNQTSRSLPLGNGKQLARRQAKSLCWGNLWPNLKPLFDTAEAISKLHLSVTEAALAISVLAVEPDRIGVKNVEAVNAVQQNLMDAAEHYISNGSTCERWANILKNLAFVRTVSNENSEGIVRRQATSLTAAQLSIQILEDAF